MRPIHELAWIARFVASEKDYSLRAPKGAGWELGQLGADFNHMLEEIERRDLALNEARDSLECRVADRTKELEGEVLDRRRAELALKENEELFRTVSETAPIGIFRSDEKGQILYVNGRWSEMTGRKAEEALGSGWEVDGRWPFIRTTARRPRAFGRRGLPWGWN